LRRSYRAVVVSLLAVAAASCESPTGLFDSPSTDWDNPIGGIEVVSFREAAQRAPFHLYRPAGLGRPDKVLVDSSSPRHPGVIALRYETGRFGLVVVTEAPPDAPIKEYEQSNRQFVENTRELLEESPDIPVSGTSEIVTIRHDQEALVTTSEDGSSSTIFWLEGHVELVVTGPALGREEVITIAGSI
jgi:hypothetical protein